jgi:hypothetical protein
MKQQPKTCAYCGQEFVPERRNGMYCSSTCRQYSYIKRKTGEAPYERTQQKETVKQELQIVPPLILEESTHDEETSNESILEPVELLSSEENKINNQSKESTTMNYNQSNTKPSTNVSYEMFLAEEKAFFNDQLAEWWNHTFGEQKEKSKLVAENQNAKNFIRQILNFNGRETTREYMQKFLYQMNKTINAPNKQSSSFFYGHTLIGEASVQPAVFLDQLRTTRKASGIFRLEPGIRAKLEVMLRFTEEFNMHSPEFWLLN